MKSMFIEIPRRFIWVKSLDATSADVDLVREFFRSSLEARCEGIMVKVLDNKASQALSPEEEEESMEEERAPVPKGKGKGKGKGKENEKEGGGNERGKGGRRKALLATYEPDKRLEVRQPINRE